MTEMLTLEVRLVFALNFSSRGGGWSPRRFERVATLESKKEKKVNLSSFGKSVVLIKISHFFVGVAPKCSDSPTYRLKICQN